MECNISPEGRLGRLHTWLLFLLAVPGWCQVHSFSAPVGTTGPDLIVPHQWLSGLGSSIHSSSTHQLLGTFAWSCKIILTALCLPAPEGHGMVASSRNTVGFPWNTLAVISPSLTALSSPLLNSLWFEIAEVFDYALITPLTLTWAKE